MKQLPLFLLILLSSFLHTAADVNVLIIGSNTSANESYQSATEPAFQYDEVAIQLRNILEGDSRGIINVTTEERYRTDITAPGAFVRATNLLTWKHWPFPVGAKTSRWQNLRGESGTAWDYVVLIGDTYTIKNIPGVYAQGVASIKEEVAKGSAETILLMTWPENATTADIDHFREVVYRTGRSGLIPVAPAAIAWQITDLPSGTSHPSQNGAYLTAATLYSRIFGQNATDSTYSFDDSLADIAYTTVMNNQGVSQFNGDFDFDNPFKFLGDKRRFIAFSEKGTSTEGRLRDRMILTLESMNISYDHASYDNNYTSNTPEDDSAGWPIENEMPIAFNQGRHPDFVSDGYKGYVTNPDYWQLGFAYLYHYNTIRFGDHILEESNDHYVARIYDELNMTDRLFGPEDLAQGRGPTARSVPLRALWAEIVKVYPNERFQTDNSGHLNAGLNRAASNFMYTIYSGRTPVEEVSTDPNFQGREAFDLHCQRVGYEMAWRMGRVQSRVPGFKVRPASATPKIRVETIQIQFLYPPQNDVTVDISISDPALAIISTSSMVFTPDNYQDIQEVTVTAIHEPAQTIELYSVDFVTTSDDVVFDGLTDSWGFETLPVGAPTPAEYDFGTDSGKITAGDAGFYVITTGNGSFNDQGDGLEVVANSSEGFENFNFSQDFQGMGIGSSEDFILAADVKINDIAGSSKENNDRWGLLMFGTSGSETFDENGITALVIARGNTNSGIPETAQMGLRQGVNGSYITSESWVGGPITVDDELRLVVAGTYVSATELSLSFTLSRVDGTDSQTITTTVSGSVLNGELFGGALRIKNGRAIEYDHFTAVSGRNLNNHLDSNNNGIEDVWEIFHFGTLSVTDGSPDSDGDGVLDFFEYLYGSNPTNGADSGFLFEATQGGTGPYSLFKWAVNDGFTIGSDYELQVSTNLTFWDPLPTEHYTVSETSQGGKNNVELSVTEPYGTKLFLRLTGP